MRAGGLRGWLRAVPAPFALAAFLPLVACADSPRPAGPPRPDRLIVLAKSDNQAVLVDPVTLVVQARLATGQAPHEVAVSPDGKLAYVSNYGLSAVFREDGQRRNRPGHTITVIDLERGAVRDSFDLGTDTQPHGIAVSRDGARVWVTCEGVASVLEVNAETGKIEQAWKTGQETSHMLVVTPDERKLYVANIGSGSVTVIERASGAVRSIVCGAGTEGLALAPDGREVWAGNRSDNTLAVIDVASDSVVARFPSDGQMPIRLEFTPDGRRVLVSNAGGHSVSVFDAAGRARVKKIGVGAVPVGIQITPDGARAFVACTNDDTVKVIDTKTWRVVQTLKPGKEPDGMAWAPGAR